MKGLEELQPVSPIGHYFNSSVLSLCILGVLESEVPIDDSPTITLLRDVFLPINPRFSSIMVTDENGLKQWKKVEVDVEKHVKYARFPEGLSPTEYDEYMSEYLTSIGMEELPQNLPLWELHIVKYPTSGAAGSAVFKLHHSLGDGYSIVGALLSCVQNAKDPSLPLRFPSQSKADKNILRRRVPEFLSLVYNTVWDFGRSLLKSTVGEDGISPIRSGNPCVQYLPMMHTTITFSLQDITHIKSNLGVTANDVISGIMFLGTRLYMKSMDNGSTTKSINGLVLLNTRMSMGYKSVQEMLQSAGGNKPIWGNQFAFLHIPVPQLRESDILNPLEFVWKAHQEIKTKKNSLGFVLTAKVLDFLRKVRGPEAAAKIVYNALKNSSIVMSHVIGPVDQVALANHPISGMYFTVCGVPESVIVPIFSYMGKVRLTIGTERGFIVPHKFKSCIDHAFKLILEASNINSSKEK